MVRFWLSLCFMVLAAKAGATTLPQIPLEELFLNTEMVVLVEIISGETIQTQQAPCGAKYQGRVIEMLKGDRSIEIVNFGYYLGYGVGNRYILFLSKSDRPFDPKSSTNAGIESAMHKAELLCSTYQPSLMVSHSGFGAMKVDWASQFQYKDAVRVASQYVGLPSSLLQKPAKPSDHEEFSDVVWVPLDGFLGQLRKLRK